MVLNTPCNHERAVNTASILASVYRNGVYDRIDPNKPRQEIFKKNPERAIHWNKRRDQCNQEIQEYNRSYGCSN